MDGQGAYQTRFEIAAISSVGDQYKDITRAIDIGFERAEILLLTGGVGPTADDITKHTLCTYFHTALVFNDEVMQNIESIFFKKESPVKSTHPKTGVCTCKQQGYNEQCRNSTSTLVRKGVKSACIHAWCSF